MTYQPSVYRQQGGDKLVVTSSGRGHAQGEIEVQSGGLVDIQSGSSFTMATDMEVKSGGLISVESGGYISFESGGYSTLPVQTLGTSQVATNITNFGLTLLTGSTTGPTYTLAAPVVGLLKYLSLSASSSGVTHRAVVNSNSTGVSFDTTGGNQITLATSALRGCTLYAQTTAKWRIVGIYSGATIASARST